MIKSITVLLGLTLIGSAFGSGFKCEGEFHNVRVFNHVNPSLGTRNPAVLVISSDEGTQLIRREAMIRKHNRRSTIQYVVEGNRRLGAEQAILQIRFQEGHTVLVKGEIVRGQLILLSGDNKQVEELACQRYLN